MLLIWGFNRTAVNQLIVKRQLIYPKRYVIWLFTLCKISAVLFFNILKMCYKQIKIMIFTALTQIFVLSSGSERLTQVQFLRPNKWFNKPVNAQIASSDLLSGTDHRKIPWTDNSHECEKNRLIVWNITDSHNRDSLTMDEIPRLSGPWLLFFRIDCLLHWG